MYSIKINFEQKGLEPVTLNDIKPDHSLLEVLLDNGMELHHNCGGVCACSTCHIYIKNGGEFLQELSDKEEDFIDRAVSPRIESRLGCQCELLAGSGEIEILSLNHLFIGMIMKTSLKNYTKNLGMILQSLKFIECVSPIY
jgi:2Fe-2S ferredoxin